MSIELMAHVLRIMGYIVDSNSIRLIVSLSVNDVSTRDIYELLTMDDRSKVSSIRLLRHKDDDSFDRVLIQF